METGDNGLEPLLPMEGMVSYRTASGEVIVAPARGKHYCEPRGYADKPGTGPKGETCRTCRHYVVVRHAKTYPKCNLTRACWTGGRKTDILVGAAACSKWEAK